MPGVEAPARHQLPQLAGQAQEAQRVRDRGAVAPDPAGDLVLGEAELVLQAVEGLRLLDRVQLLALDVLDEGQLEEVLVRRPRAP